MSKYILLTACFLMVLSVSAEVITVQLKNEAYDKNVKVSGHLRSGVMYEAQKGGLISLPPKYIYLNLAHAEHATVCGKITSVNGNYEASFSTGDLKNIKGHVQLLLDSHLENITTDFMYEDLAALVYESNKNCKKIINIIPSSWTTISGNKLQVYLNSGQFNTKLLLYPKDKKKPSIIQCAKIAGVKQVAYDTQCDVDLLKGYDLLRTKIKRSNGINRVKTINLPVNLSTKSESKNNNI